MPAHRAWSRGRFCYRANIVAYAAYLSHWRGQMIDLASVALVRKRTYANDLVRLHRFDDLVSSAYFTRRSLATSVLSSVFYSHGNKYVLTTIRQQVNRSIGGSRCLRRYGPTQNYSKTSYELHTSLRRIDLDKLNAPATTIVHDGLGRIRIEPMPGRQPALTYRAAARLVNMGRDDRRRRREEAWDTQNRTRSRSL